MNIHRVVHDRGPAIKTMAMDFSPQTRDKGRSMPRDIPLHRPPSPSENSSRSVSIAGSVMSDVPPLLPLMPQFPPLDHTMDWRREDAEEARRRSRQPDHLRTAFSEGNTEWERGGLASPAMGRVSQSHTEGNRIPPRFAPTLDFSDRVDHTQSKQLHSSTSLLQKQLTERGRGLQPFGQGKIEGRRLESFDLQMLDKLNYKNGHSSLQTPISPIPAGRASNPPSPHLRDERRPSNAGPAPMGIPNRIDMENHLMAINPANYPPVFPPAVLAGGIPPRRKHAARRSPPEGLGEDDYRDYRMRKSPSISLSLTMDMDESHSPRGHVSRGSQEYADSENDLQMEDIPPQMNMLTLRESQTPPRTPSAANSMPRIQQTAGSKRRASSPQGTQRNRLQISQSEPGPYGDNFMRRSPVGNPYAPARLSPQSATSRYAAMAVRHGASGPGSVLSTSTSSGSTQWSLLGTSSNFSAASSISTSDGLSAFSSPRDLDMADGSSPNSLTPRTSTVATRESSISHGLGAGKMESAETPGPAPQRSHLMPNFNGTYLCECCPKKPKKFDNLHDLEQHEQEKQHICQYCHNRFKNKNEAERHQNSLHLRKHSWSCSSLASPTSVFHPSKSGTCDICGYCGAEFANPANWAERQQHLTMEHKFGECNQTKKFYRADHFRQHLKHSHAGTSGKWTNVLENACMVEEAPEGEA